MDDRGELPRSWQHYQLGMRWLQAEQSRRSLKMHEAVLMAGVKKDDKAPWITEQEVKARWWNPEQE